MSKDDPNIILELFENSILSESLTNPNKSQLLQQIINGREINNTNFDSIFNDDNIDLEQFLSKPIKCNKCEQFSETEFAEFLHLIKSPDATEHNNESINFGNRHLFTNNDSNTKARASNCYPESASGKYDSTRNYHYNSGGKQNINKKPRSSNTSNENAFSRQSSFKTANDELNLQNLKRFGSNSNSDVGQQQYSYNNNGAGLSKRQLGTRRPVRSGFVSPLLSNNSSNEDIKLSNNKPQEPVDERLKHIEVEMIELIRSEIMDCKTDVQWSDIAGLEFAKTAIQEAVVWPMLRPDIFTGLRRPPKGILLFGPPGTGKTLIGKCVAVQSKSTFFSISASSLTSKWIGNGEKMVRALFAVARVHEPAVIFIDEIDSLLSQRSDTEHESSRRIKTEFLIQLDGATTDNEERILVIAATNRPQELDEAARRRFVKRLYIPLPEYQARLQLVERLIAKERHSLEPKDYENIAQLSAGYSGADIRNLCSEASLGPIRAIDMRLIEKIQATEVRPLNIQDFDAAFTRVKSSVSQKDLEQYLVYDQTYGSGV